MAAQVCLREGSRGCCNCPHAEDQPCDDTEGAERGDPTASIDVRISGAEDQDIRLRVDQVVAENEAMRSLSVLRAGIRSGPLAAEEVERQFLDVRVRCVRPARSRSR